MERKGKQLLGAHVEPHTCLLKSDDLLEYEVSMEDLISGDIVTNLLDRYGWQWKKTNEGNIVTGFQGFSGNFLLGFDIKKEWLAIFTIEYLPKISLKKQEEVYSSILECNAETPYIRFAKTSEGVIFIVADVLIKNKKIDFDSFKLTMDLICEAADRFYPDLYEQITGEKLLPPSEEGA